MKYDKLERQPVLNRATREKSANGDLLLESNPVRRLEVTPTVTPGEEVDPPEDQRNAG